MGILEIVYSIAGFGGVALLVWAVRSIKKWGAADSKRKEAEKAQVVAERQLKEIRDVKKIHDTIKLNNDERVRIRDKYK